MAGMFHWIKIRLFCYSTEDQEKLHNVMSELTGTDDFDAEQSDGHHGNATIIFTSEITSAKVIKELFIRLGKDITNHIIIDIDNRVDEDCTFYLRLNKQKAVTGVYDVAHHGDVISITGKVVSHPARKEIAVEKLKEYLSDLFL